MEKDKLFNLLVCNAIDYVIENNIESVDASFIEDVLNDYYELHKYESLDNIKVHIFVLIYVYNGLEESDKELLHIMIEKINKSHNIGLIN